MQAYIASALFYNAVMMSLIDLKQLDLSRNDIGPKEVEK